MPANDLEALLDVVGQILERRQIRPVDADDDRVARAGEHLADALLEVGLDVAPQTGIAVDDLLDGGERLVVVDRRVDADPVLAEFDAVRLVGDERLADVGAEVADAGDLAAAPCRRRC